MKEERPPFLAHPVMNAAASRHTGFACRCTLSTSFSQLGTNEGNVRTCSQQVLQELLAIGMPLNHLITKPRQAKDG